jgi:hypothetical protein
MTPGKKISLFPLQSLIEIEGFYDEGADIFIIRMVYL